MTENRFSVEHRPAEHRYVILDTAAEGGPAVAGEESYVDVTAADGRRDRVLFHTGVEDAYGGQGLAGQLVRFAVEDTIHAGLRVAPVCPYVVSWLEKHPGFAEHTVPAGPRHLRAVQRG